MSDDPPTTHLPAINTALKGFYEAASSFWSVKVDPLNVRVKHYDLAHPMPRAPIADDSLGMSGATGASELPAELAICLSFQGSRVAGVSQARRRGRIYFGPLASVALSSGAIASAARTALKNAGMSLLTASLAATAWDWIVYSPTSPVGSRSTNVVGGWVDDAVDIQRRRGVDATVRLTWPP